MYFLETLLSIVLIFTSFILSAKTDSYRCMWRDNPATSMVIGWNQTNDSESRLYLDSISHNGLVESFPIIHDIDVKRRYKGMNNRFVRLDKLKPNTVYYFVISDGESNSAEMSFKTMPSDNRNLSIIAGGDSRNHRQNRQKANILVSKLRPDFVMFAGDMTGADNSKNWKRWMEDWQLTIGMDGRLTPIVVARGNHERSNKVLYELFDLPNEDNYYSLSFGEDLLHIITLNSMISAGGKQRDWLEKELKNSIDYKWNIAQYHHPIRPHTYKKSEKYSQQKFWATLFYEYKMDLVVECDAHVVKTTYPIRPSKEEGSEEGFIRDDKAGTIYVGEGCWGAPLRKNNDNKNWTRASGSFNQFKWIFVREKELEIRTVKTHNAMDVGRLYDENKFDYPSNLDIWEPETGAVLIVLNKKNGGSELQFEKVEMTAIALNSPKIKMKGRYLTFLLFLPFLLFMIYPFITRFRN